MCVKLDNYQESVILYSVRCQFEIPFLLEEKKTRIESILNKILTQTFKIVVDDPIRQLRELGMYDPQ